MAGTQRDLRRASNQRPWLPRPWATTWTSYRAGSPTYTTAVISSAGGSCLNMRRFNHVIHGHRGHETRNDSVFDSYGPQLQVNAFDASGEREGLLSAVLRPACRPCHRSQGNDQRHPAETRHFDVHRHNRQFRRKSPPRATECRQAEQPGCERIQTPCRRTGAMEHRPTVSLFAISPAMCVDIPAGSRLVIPEVRYFFAACRNTELRLSEQRMCAMFRHRHRPRTSHASGRISIRRHPTVWTPEYSCPGWHLSDVVPGANTAACLSLRTGCRTGRSDSPATAMCGIPVPRRLRRPS
jgi:hypothetical protein